MVIHRTWTNNLALVISLFSILLLGVTSLPTPLFGDQAFFLLGAKEMNEGLVLYRDFWDIKQPGIFYFYLLGGRLFGFTEVGIHLFELFYWLLFAIVSIWFFKKFRIFENQYLSYFAPLAIVGTYYSVCYAQLMTQVEILVNFPLLLVLIFNQLYLSGGNKKLLWLLLSGIAGGLVLFFKMMFALILVAIWLPVFFKQLKTASFLKTSIRFLMLPLGIILFWIPFLIYCYHHQILQLCYETFFIYPPLVLKHGSAKPIIKLLYSFKNYFSNVILIIPLVIISAGLLKKHMLVLELWLWFILAFIIILLQKTSWYQYQFQILYVPLILLSLITVDRLIWKNYFRVLNFNSLIPLVLLLILLNSPAIIELAKKIAELSRYNFALTEKDKQDYAFLNNDNIKAYEITRYFNENVKENCPIFVVNDPLVYYYTGRNQAISQSGWSLQLFIPGQWELLHKELEAKRPCYIFIRFAFNPYFETKGKKIMNWIKENYVIYNTNSHGIWYKLI